MLVKALQVVIIFVALISLFTGLVHNDMVIDMWRVIRSYLGFKVAKVWVLQRELLQYLPIVAMSIYLTFNKHK